jgi:large subunit ribosomal protein L13e
MLSPAQEAGIPVKYAPTIGIAVDHRRKNRSEESLQENAKRLKAYKAKLIVFPRRSAKPKVRTAARAGAKRQGANAERAQSGDSPKEELSVVAQLKGKLLPITKAAPKVESVAVTAEMKAAKAYATLRLERMNARLVGIRAKKAAAAEKEKEKD